MIRPSPPGSHYGRTCAEGKKIGWRDGFRAIYVILKYNPYRDAPAGELAFDVGPVLPGAAGLRTNARTYVVLTDASAVWIRRPQRNPLPC